MNGHVYSSRIKNPAKECTVRRASKAVTYNRCWPTGKKSRHNNQRPLVRVLDPFLCFLCPPPLFSLFFSLSLFFPLVPYALSLPPTRLEDRPVSHRLTILFFILANLYLTPRLFRAVSRWLGGSPPLFPAVGKGNHKFHAFSEASLCNLVVCLLQESH